MNGYELSRNWFDWSFENPELISPTHTAIYFFAIEHCNRLGWKDKFGFPSQMAMDAIGVKKHQTFIKHFADLVEWGFIKLVQKSKNQYSANIISLQSAMPKNGKALDKALVKHGAKQGISMGQSTGQSKDSIDKQLTINKEQETINNNPTVEEFVQYYFSELSFQFPEREFSVRAKYESWIEAGWKDGNGSKIRNWKTKLKNTIPHLRATPSNNGSGFFDKPKKPTPREAGLQAIKMILAEEEFNNQTQDNG
jgi:hypothetical protein